MMLVDRNISRTVELEISRSTMADARQERLLTQRPWLHSMIGPISDEDAIMIVIDRDAICILELAWLTAFLAELGHERAIIAREHLHSVVGGIDDEQEASMMVERQASREVEHAIVSAILVGADRELDSSVTIKGIVFHLSQFNPSQSTSHNDKEMIQAPTCKPRDEDTKVSHARDTRETPSNKNQSMKEQRTTLTRASSSCCLRAPVPIDINI